MKLSKYVKTIMGILGKSTKKAAPVYKIKGPGDTGDKYRKIIKPYMKPKPFELP